MKVKFLEKRRILACLVTILFLPPLALLPIVAGNDSALAAPPDDAVVVCEAVFSSSDFARVREDAEHKKCLDDLAIRIQELKLKDPPVELFLIIDGHRDSTETVGISLTRANNFRDFLVGEMQVDGSRIKVRHFGDTCPVAARPSSNPTASTGENNRRVRIWIVAKDKEAPNDQAGMKCRSGSTPREITNEEPATSKDSLPN